LVKKIAIIFSLFYLFWSCATYQPPPPSIYISNLPPTIVSELTLDERILTEEAWSNIRQGKGSKASKIISKLGQENPFYYVGLGYASLLLNNFSESEMYFKQALRNSPQMSLVHLGLAQVYQKTGREEEEFLALREVLKIEPDNPWAKQTYATLKNKKTKEALSQAQSYLAQQQIEKSKQAFLKALYYSSQSTEANLALAKIYTNEGNLQNALVHLRSAFQNNPKNKKILETYADALFKAEDYPRSLNVYEKLQEMEPGNKKIEKRIKTLKNRLGIFELPSQYKAIPASEAISKEEIAALLAVKLKDFLGEPTSKPPIIIDISTSWASKYILKTTTLGILDVYSNHTFQPKKIVTRAEMAEILWRLINYLKGKGYKFIRQIPLEKIKISDVSPQNVYYLPIVQIISYDIMTLSSEKTFNPDLPLSGHEAERLLNIILTLIK